MKTTEENDLLLTVEVLQGRAAADAVAEYERRFVEEEGFRQTAGPLVELWLAPIDVRLIVGGGNGSGAPEIPLRDPIQPSGEVDGSRSKTSRLIESLRGIRFLGVRGLIVLLVFFIVIAPMLMPLWLRDEADGVVGVHAVPMHPQIIGVQVKVPSPLPRPGGVSSSPARENQPFGEVAGEPIRTSRALRLMLDLNGATVSADSTQLKVVELRGGSRVIVRPRSSIRHGGFPGITFARIVEVNGEAVIEVVSDSRVVEVLSRAGGATLSQGMYAVRCVALCEALEVTVIRGKASLAPDLLGPNTELELKAPRFGFAFLDAAPLAVTAKDAKGFPAAESTLEATIARAKETRVTAPPATRRTR